MAYNTCGMYLETGNNILGDNIKLYWLNKIDFHDKVWIISCSDKTHMLMCLMRFHLKILIPVDLTDFDIFV